MTARAAMAGDLRLDPSSPTKTFVLDVHPDGATEPIEFLSHVVGDGLVEPTDDAWLYRVDVADGRFWVDQLDERFWSFHTDMATASAKRFLHERVEAHRTLDWMWLPSEHLRRAWPDTKLRRVRTEFAGSGFLGGNDPASGLKLQATGSEADSLLDLLAKNDRYRSAVSLDGIELAIIDSTVGRVNEAVDRLGRFAASGDAFELHVQFVRGVVKRYSTFVTMCESRALSWGELPDASLDGGGGRISGDAILVKFNRDVTDMARFVDELLAARQPFRLWGVPQIHDGVAEIEAVDLHVGLRLRLDVGQSWMRIYLEKGSCGNTVARLLANLQHRFDSALRLFDPDLQDAFMAHCRG